MHLAVFRADQNRRFTAPADVRVLRGRGGEDAGHAGIHRIAAQVIHAHGGVGRIAAAGGDRAMRSARGVLRGTFRRTLLRQRQTEERQT